MNRSELIQYAAISCLVAQENEASQRHAAKHARQTAEKLADELGAKPDFTQHDLEIELRAALKQRDERIAELEAQLEAATAPAKKGGR